MMAPIRHIASNSTVAYHIGPKPASVRCAAAGSREYCYGLEPYFWPASTSCSEQVNSRPVSNGPFSRNYLRHLDLIAKSASRNFG